MDRARFEKLVEDGIGAIPARFREKLKNVAILVEDEPSAEQLASVGMEPDENGELLGLYEGVSNIEGGHTHRGLPDRITVFSLAILEEAERAEGVPRIVAETVRHEIAHHFGMDEDEVERAERRER
ncbi:MAG: metallopeptidase family protein [Candidatus Jorgensenbacteria bacterium]